MYRLKTTLDCELLFMEQELTSEQNILKERMLEILETLDDAYGKNRSSHDFGGYILFFPTEDNYKRQIAQILKFYNLDKNLCEYREKIGEKAYSDTEWWEELFLLSSDDSLLLIYPKETRQNV